MENPGFSKFLFFCFSQAFTFLPPNNVSVIFGAVELASPGSWSLVTLNSIAAFRHHNEGLIKYLLLLHPNVDRPTTFGSLECNKLEF